MGEVLLRQESQTRPPHLVTCSLVVYASTNATPTPMPTPMSTPTAYRKDTGMQRRNACALPSRPAAARYTLKPANIYRDSYHWDPIVLDGSDYAEAGNGPLRFNVIDTSNLIDHLNLLAAVAPLLLHGSSSSLYTECLVQREDSQQDHINSLLCGHFPTMSTLMGLFPVEYWANTSPYSTVDELLLDSNYGTADDLTHMRQRHIKLTWKQTTTGLVSHTPDIRTTLQMDELGLARILHKVYLNMFRHENIQLLLSGLSPRSMSAHSMPRYHRGSFALILRFVRSRVATKWDMMIGHLLDLIEAETTVMMSLNYIQELYLYLHLYGVVSVATLSSSPTQPNFPGEGRLRNWKNTPSLMCVILVVPREKVQVITNVDTDEIGSPIMHCVIQSSQSYRAQRWQNIFSVVQVSFGNLSGTGAPNTDSFQLSIAEDELRWSGSSSLIVSFLVPTWTLLLKPQAARIAFGIQSTPATAQTFLRTLGVEMNIFETNLGDESSVFFSRFPPNHKDSSSLLLLPSPGQSPSSTETSVASSKISANIDSTGLKMTTLTCRLQIHSEDLRKALQRGDEVQTSQRSPCTFLETVGPKSIPIAFQFPAPVIRMKSKTRIARKSLYIEVEAPLADATVWKTFPAHLYPVILAGSTPLMLNMSRLNLDCLPIVDTSTKSEIQWLNMHVGGMFNTRVFLSFLQGEPALPTQLEHVNLTRLCFAQLSLASHASDISRDSIREYIIRGEYAFTEYSIIYAFDHLLNVLSERDEASTSNYGALSINLREFVAKRVSTPKERAEGKKHIDSKLQVFKAENFYDGLKHAITYHRDSLEKPTNDVEEKPVLAVLQQFAHVRSVLEKMVTSGLTTNLNSLYGQCLFKCSEPRCESFHNGFSTQQIRDKHRDRHERIYLCSIPGCSSAMIGFSTFMSLQKHEKDYHEGINGEISFPWHGTLGSLNISKEIKQGNYSAFELWLYQWKDLVPDDQIADWRNSPLRAASYSQNRILKQLISKIRPNLKPYIIKWHIYEGIRAGNEEGAQIMIRHFDKLRERDIYELLAKALRVGMDEAAKEFLKHPSSPLHDQLRPSRKTSYLNLAIRFDRFAVFQHILRTYQVDPNQIDDKGRNSLHATAEFGRTEIAAYLIETKRCDKCIGNKKGDTPLVIAGRQGYEEFIASIYHETISETEVQVWLRVAQLRNAARDGNDEKVRELLNEGLGPIDEVDTQNRSPWLWAVQGNHNRVVEAFLSNNDVMFKRGLPLSYGKNNTWPSALHLAALSGNDSMVRALLQSGKFDDEIDRVCGYFGKWPKGPKGRRVTGSPLRIAMDCKHKDIVKIIKHYKASLDKNNKEPPETIFRIPEIPEP
ncbi:uncharacterized protein BDR25DRAFT_358593 [Lindgomyces ingoldianus]|uniref:Uncharacterized protein n=1 Tax=Lindgomyces ingoldianus TaxID=673940 RepID=A0ACB6QMY1_9PLEO|nr:uncharacterized protein BDR25DRAFT_358593 [Lindgomyces ingoldianus]KAF2467482.1 hypothetical protein BDR25DRAFT_358593 [Lindgomyces ingoldianus]